MYVYIYSWFSRANTLATRCEDWLIRKDPDAGKDWKQEKGMTEDETVGRPHWLEGHEFDQAPGVRQGTSQWTGKPSILQSIGLQRVGNKWATEQQQIADSLCGRNEHNIAKQLHPTKKEKLSFALNLFDNSLVFYLNS